jgi:hypothetical protein
MDIWEETSGETEGITGIRNQVSTKRLHLGSRITLNKTFWKTAELEIVK